MQFKALCFFIGLMTIPLNSLFAQNGATASISGIIKADSTKRPLEFVNVVVLNGSDSSIVTGTVTDAKGRFEINGISSGSYILKPSLLGFVEKKPITFTVDPQHNETNLGTIFLTETALILGEVTVTSQRMLFNNAIDRKVYNVQQDIMSKTGTASDLLQNVPSVQVDVDGTVSLRGSSNVLILVNGKPSPLMSKNSAEVLQQMPANTIERIEVITNPSAKFKPDGTSGIINIVMKKETSTGLNGTVAANVGNKRRYNGTVTLNYNPGPLNIFGSYSYRQDERNNFTTDTRVQHDSATGTPSYYDGHGISLSRPFSHILKLGADYRFDDVNSAGISGNYLYRGFTRTETASKLFRSSNLVATGDYDRLRYDPEYEQESGLEVYFEHKFEGDDHKIRLEFNTAITPEQEDNHYTNVYRTPSIPSQYDNTLIKQTENKQQVSLDYSYPMGDKARLETGYAGDFNKRDMDFHGSYFDTVAGQFVTDVVKTNHFVYTEYIHALYGTYEQTIGPFSFLAGLRGESSQINADLVSRDSVIRNDYFKIYPTLHLAYKLSELLELQLNYSRRVNRPEGDDLNPFPEYQDPRNVRAGNPKLMPEFIHSVEFGVQWQNDNITFVPSVFYRNKYNGFTTTAKALNDSTLLTTHENLSTDQSAGLEFVLAGNIGNLVSANASANAFYEEIDASNLGFGAKKSTVSWSGTLNCNFNPWPGTTFQVNSNYRSLRLTPQGENRATYVVNLGIRKDLLDDKLSVVLTASDLLKTLNRATDLNTSLLNESIVSNRDSQIFYLGLIYHFGRPSKKSKEKELQYDNSL